MTQNTAKQIKNVLNTQEFQSFMDEIKGEKLPEHVQIQRVKDFFAGAISDEVDTYVEDDGCRGCW